MSTSMPRQGLQQLLQALPNWPSLCQQPSIPVLTAISKCRTAALGYHLYECADPDCAHQSMQFHSCRNRHCPHCGGMKKDEWIEARMRELLPCKYYHMVFTIPHQLNSIVLGNRKAMFNLLFEVSSYTLQTFALDPNHLGATLGIISVLHTWGQQLSFHPHVHCIVTGSGLTKQNEWLQARKAKYGRLFPVQAMEVVYRSRFIKRLQELLQTKELILNEQQQAEWKNMIDKLYQLRWIIHAKEPFGGPEQVVKYLGRYTHKVAISNSRIKSIDPEQHVTFDYKDYRSQGQIKQMTLPGIEFLRRFEQHILPKRFCKIRSYGLYGNYKRTNRIRSITDKLHLPPHPTAVITPWYIRFMERYGNDPLLCPHCKKAKLKLVDKMFPAAFKVKIE